MEKPKMPYETIVRETFIKRPTVKTSPLFGCKPEDRTTEELLEYSIINVDKPKGPTSHQVSSYVQKILHINKSGHSGTLDPKVTGVLPIAVGRATRIVQALLSSGKEYICVMHLHSLVPEEQIREVMEGFEGKMKQLPPIKSAVKRRWRIRKIYYIQILEIIGQDVLFRVGCQAGTYIRKLCHDIGQKLDTGAHMAELRRSKVGPFNEESTLTSLIDLQDAYWFYKNEGNDKWLRKLLQPIETAVGHLPKVWVVDSAVNALAHGVDLMVPGVVKIESHIQLDDMVAVMTLKDELIAFGTAKMISKDIVTNQKGIAIKTNKIFMQQGVYPQNKRE